MALGEEEEEPQLRLVGMWSSPFVVRVRLALHLKGLAYDYIQEDLLAGKSDLLLQSNPVHKKVPVFLHHGRAICESRIIVEYIDEVYAGTGPSILPADPYDRTLHRFWAAYFDDKVIPSLAQLMYGETGQERAEAGKQMIAHFQLMEANIKDGLLAGDSIGLLGIVLGTALPWLELAEKLPFGVKLIDETSTPMLASWKAQFLASTEAAKELLPEAAKLMDFVNTARAMRFGEGNGN